MNDFGRTSCLILSAGQSTRAGRHKALMMYDSQTTFIRHIVCTYMDAGVKQVVVVAGADLIQILQETEPDLSKKIKLILNPNPELDRFHSFRLGLIEIPEGHHIFFQNVDNPLVTSDILEQLIIHKNKAEVIVPSFEGKNGHPVLIGSAVKNEALKNSGSAVRIDHFLRKFRAEFIEVNSSEILVNINTIADYNSYFGQ